MSMWSLKVVPACRESVEPDRSIDFTVLRDAERVQLDVMLAARPTPTRLESPGRESGRSGEKDIHFLGHS